MVIAGYAATVMSSRGVLRDKKMTCSNEGTVREDDQSTTGRRALASEVANAREMRGFGLSLGLLAGGHVE